MSYAETYKRSITDPAEFWADAAKLVDWETEPSVILDDTNPPFYRWYADGVLNTCYNALDRHVKNGRADQLALIYDSPVTETVTKFTYRELQGEVARLAGALTSLGVTEGDRVIIYMPMIPELAVAMLACTRIGVAHSVIFGGFSPLIVTWLIGVTHIKTSPSFYVLATTLISLASLWMLRGRSRAH